MARARVRVTIGAVSGLTSELSADGEQCSVCGGCPRVVVAVEHPALRRLIGELLDREHGCWRAELLEDQACAAAVLAADPPDLVVIDSGDFSRCRRESLRAFPPRWAIVIGPEPDPAYRRAALHDGAGGWLPRDRVADDLSTVMRRALGCTHAPCPPEPA